MKSPTEEKRLPAVFQQFPLSGMEALRLGHPGGPIALIVVVEK